MAKNKGIREKLRLYYRGPLKNPTLVADERTMKVVTSALVECLPLRFKHAFKCRWQDRNLALKLVVGLSAGLRHLKRKRTRAILFDNTASDHLANLLVEFSDKLGIPSIKANGLIDLAPQLNLKTLLVISLVDATTDEPDLYKESDPRPKPVESTLDLQSFRDLIALFVSPNPKASPPSKAKGKKFAFKPPHLDNVKSTGKSKGKKEARKVRKCNEKSRISCSPGAQGKKGASKS